MRIGAQPSLVVHKHRCRTGRVAFNNQLVRCRRIVAQNRVEHQRAPSGKIALYPEDVPHIRTAEVDRPAIGQATGNCQCPRCGTSQQIRPVSDRQCPEVEDAAADRTVTGQCGPFGNPDVPASRQCTGSIVHDKRTVRDFRTAAMGIFGTDPDNAIAFLDQFARAAHGIREWPVAIAVKHKIAVIGEARRSQLGTGRSGQRRARTDIDATGKSRIVCREIHIAAIGKCHRSCPIQPVCQRPLRTGELKLSCQTDVTRPQPFGRQQLGACPALDINGSGKVFIGVGNRQCATGQMQVTRSGKDAVTVSACRHRQ